MQDVDGETVYLPVEATKQQGGTEYATKCVYKCRICFAEFGKSDLSYHLVQNRVRHIREDHVFIFDEMVAVERKQGCLAQARAIGILSALQAVRTASAHAALPQNAAPLVTLTLSRPIAVGGGISDQRLLHTKLFLMMGDIFRDVSLHAI